MAVKVISNLVRTSRHCTTMSHCRLDSESLSPGLWVPVCTYTYVASGFDLSPLDFMLLSCRSFPASCIFSILLCWVFIKFRWWYEVQGEILPCGSLEGHDASAFFPAFVLQFTPYLMRPSASPLQYCQSCSLWILNTATFNNNKIVVCVLPLWTSSQGILFSSWKVPGFCSLLSQLKLRLMFSTPSCLCSFVENDWMSKHTQTRCHAHHWGKAVRAVFHLSESDTSHAPTYGAP